MVGLSFCWQNMNDISWEEVNLTYLSSAGPFCCLSWGSDMMLDDSQGIANAGLCSGHMLALLRCTKGFAPLRECCAEEGL